MTVHIQDSPARAYREAGEAHDLDALMATLADDVVFRSPLSATASFRGRTQVRELFAVVLDALSELRYQSDLGDERTRMLTATARLGRQELHEATLLSLGEDGLVEEITMWVRPLPALTALMAALGPGLARATGRPGLPLLVGAAVKPLAAMTRLGDRTLVPLLTTKRPR
ncbi:nuclear transport factor 2 family protein [Nonomuraea turkmeniaca]|uniref:Nuclear transport factor 2 family protein n=1 Tax=Nonomuraea turkmeniaca TaxID=103838 RepID=A0A5S4FI78_9ACTN|nr:nuclear transport factor 2 family protein [Nonomuraea turkmeniaca]TMR19090.1 nuclear transport factor 2 family protein [Nonomuraea turkmeniaca]